MQVCRRACEPQDVGSRRTFNSASLVAHSSHEQPGHSRCHDPECNTVGQHDINNQANTSVHSSTGLSRTMVMCRIPAPAPSTRGSDSSGRNSEGYSRTPEPTGCVMRPRRPAGVATPRDGGGDILKTCPPDDSFPGSSVVTPRPSRKPYATELSLQVRSTADALILFSGSHALLQRCNKTWQDTRSSETLHRERTLQEFMTRTKQLEDRLMAVNAEKDMLEGELARLPENGRTLAERNRKAVAESQLVALNKEAGTIRMSLKQMGAMQR